MRASSWVISISCICSVVRRQNYNRRCEDGNNLRSEIPDGGSGPAHEYVKMYKQAIQEIKLAGCRGGLILCSENDPGSVLVLLEWESKEHHLRWRGTPPHTRFRAAVEGWQSKPSTGGYYLAETI